jgi:hypothetical protein
VQNILRDSLRANNPFISFMLLAFHDGVQARIHMLLVVLHDCLINRLLPIFNLSETSVETFVYL